MSISFSPGDLVSARGREWVVLPAPAEGLLALRPLSGNEAEATILDPALELHPVAPACFELPVDAGHTVQPKATLLADALRLTLRRGAGPFRCAAQLSFEPRAYQLVPLLMALRLQHPRLLIADDVGIGKTIEAGLILREFIDRGEVDAFAVLCPPHLVEQWSNELRERFGIEATVLTAASANRLERHLPPGRSLFEEHPRAIVSLDYIKAERRRDAFARTCPDFVIIDEAHACVGTHRGRQQRFALLQGLARRRERAMIMLTATPHSGDEDAFARLLSLIDPQFGELRFRDENWRRRLQRHFVQRRRADITNEQEWGEERAFPQHEAAEATYHLDADHLAFQEAVLDYCFSVVRAAGEERHRQRLAFWGTLALMRCVGSSPAAALSALTARARRLAEGADAESRAVDADLEEHIYDEDDDEDAIDMEPDPGMQVVDDTLRALIKQADALRKKSDPKLKKMHEVLQPLLAEGFHPVIFCRYVATAEHVGAYLRQEFPYARIEVVTGHLTPEERRERVAAMLPDDDDEDARQRPRILVATDCLSEGINLQIIFNAVVHYDLSWNPTRHQQREGRVDRFGQPSPVVRSVMMYSPDSPIDGAVLDVILRKAEAIRRHTGVTVPLPEERAPLTEALMAAMQLKRQKPQQLALDFGQAELDHMENYWRDVAEAEKRSRTRFAQHAMRPQEVIREWRKAQTLLGTPEEAFDFVERSMRTFGVALEKRRDDTWLAHLDGLQPQLRQRLAERGLQGSLRLARREPAPAGATPVSRSHPLVAGLGELLLEAALEPEGLQELAVGRVGAWPTRAVQQRTLLALLRIRHKLHVRSRRERLLLAEEAALLALDPLSGKVVATGEAALQLLRAEAAHDLAPPARERFVQQAHAQLAELLDGPLAQYARQRAAELQEDHARVRNIGGEGTLAQVEVQAALPVDVIGLFTLLPAA